MRKKLQIYGLNVELEVMSDILYWFFFIIHCTECVFFPKYLQKKKNYQIFFNKLFLSFFKLYIHKISTF